MRRRILLATVVAGFFFATQAEAQNCNTPELTQKLSIFSEYAKAKNYKEAYPIWKEVYTQCPTLHYATLLMVNASCRTKLELVTVLKKHNL